MPDFNRIPRPPRRFNYNIFFYLTCFSNSPYIASLYVYAYEQNIFFFQILLYQARKPKIFMVGRLEVLPCFISTTTLHVATSIRTKSKKICVFIIFSLFIRSTKLYVSSYLKELLYLLVLQIIHFN